MFLCSDGHDEVCYSDSAFPCPVCDKMEIIEQLELEVEHEDEQIRNLQEALANAEKR